MTKNANKSVSKLPTKSKSSTIDATNYNHVLATGLKDSEVHIGILRFGMAKHPDERIAIDLAFKNPSDESSSFPGSIELGELEDGKVKKDGSKRVSRPNWLVVRPSEAELDVATRQKLLTVGFDLTKFYSPSYLAGFLAKHELAGFAHSSAGTFNGHKHIFLKDGKSIYAKGAHLTDGSQSVDENDGDNAASASAAAAGWGVSTSPETTTALRCWASRFDIVSPTTLHLAAFNLILEGVPGTGKTFSLSELRAESESEFGQGRFAMTMHPATAYEDFVEGLRPGLQPDRSWWNFVDADNRSIRIGIKGDVAVPTGDDGWLNLNPNGDQTFTVHDGFFVRVCREAVHFPDKTFVVLLDEINRCNIPKVMGDLLTTLEPSKRAKWVAPKDDFPGYWDTSSAQVVTLPYSQRSFFVPDNIIVVGTMNTTDRSVAPMDAALRRRFAFARVYPLGFDSSGFVTGDDDIEAAVGKLKKAVPLSWALWKALNAYLQSKFGDDAMLGHSYLHALKEALTIDKETQVPESDKMGMEIACSHWNLYIFPQLIDVLVSNDLVDEVLKVKDKAVDVEASFDEAVRKASAPFDKMKIQMRGTGLLRTPTIRFDWPPLTTESAARPNVESGNDEVVPDETEPAAATGPSQTPDGDDDGAAPPAGTGERPATESSE